MPREFLQTGRIAYFTMEVALCSDIPTYAGGLGILAGDTVRAAADLELPLVTVSLVSRDGYFRQRIDAEGRQVELPQPWEPESSARPLDARVAVQIEGRNVWVGGWLYVLQSPQGGRQPVILLDTQLGDNASEDRQITARLYGGDPVYRLKQEIVLGIGGVRMLHALGFKIRRYHLNEGHAALLALELMRMSAYPAEQLREGDPPYDIPEVRAQCIFTTHTPVEAGHDKFPYSLVERVLGDFVDVHTLKREAGSEAFNMTRLALNLSDYVNGVAERHAETSRRMFPGYRVRAITNGVHPGTWTSAPFAELYDRHVAGWRHEPELLVRADCCIPDADIWEAHIRAKRALIDRVRSLCGVALAPNLPILGFARRMTAYKRPDLLFHDLAGLERIAARFPFQLVLAGKAHPADEAGKQLITRLHACLRQLSGRVQAAYLPDYDMALAMELVAGADVWLNTPLRPLEASGTSGMKAALNGVPSLSVLDGWWAEGCIEGVTGWAIGDGTDGPGSDEGKSMYGKLEDVVLPLYYAQERARWIAVMKGAIAKNAPFFNTHRMMRRYASDAYVK